MHSGRLLLRFEGVADRTAAEALRGPCLVVEVDPAELPEDPDEFYDHQLIGLAVVDRDGTACGRSPRSLHLPSQDLLAVRRADRRTRCWSRSSRRSSPRSTSPPAGVVIDPPPGLLELTSRRGAP